ncbi:MAG: hypothetical protein IPK81_21125 [Rhodospirillales bacterium]|nr:MAG: hypothetical protein IPK81_21125 [Rhodospirillales bacterium]
MPTPLDAFTAHPRAVGETYAQHLGMASGFGLRMIAGGVACLLHGLLPFLFTTTGSRAIRALHDDMVSHRRRVPADGVAVARPAE